jgi:hypothetical protein
MYNPVNHRLFVKEVGLAPEPNNVHQRMHSNSGPIG